MLLSFRVANHRSFRAEQELLLLPAYDKSRPAVPVAGIYGANASGKSNLLSALSFMRSAVLGSFSSWGPLNAVPRDPFAFTKAALDEPSTFAVDLLIKGDKYIYGFAIDSRHVSEEWLFHYPRGRRRLLFERQGSDFRFGDSLRGPKHTIEEVTRPNCLFLSTAAHHRLQQLLPVYAWFQDSLNFQESPISDKIKSHVGRLRTVQLLGDAGVARRITELLRAADLGIRDIRLDAKQGSQSWQIEDFLAQLKESNTYFGQLIEKLSNAPESVGSRTFPALKNPDWEFTFDDQWRPVRVALVHDTPEGPVALPLGKESRGTQTWFNFLGLIVDVLDGEQTLIIDELDTSLHPLLAREFVRLFQNLETNPNGAQLIFTTHDASLLARQKGEEVLRRDEVWFTEKLASGETQLFPLTDFKPRAGLNWERRYLGGSVGAVPFLDPGDFAAALGPQPDSDG